MHFFNPALPSLPESRHGRGVHILITVVLSLGILANTGLIFSMSAESAPKSSERSGNVTNAIVEVLYPDIEERPPEEQQRIFETVHRVIRKLAHFSEFMLLGCLTALLAAHLSTCVSGLKAWVQWGAPAVLGLLCAMLDEALQRFTGRGPSLGDVLLDFAGALAGVLFARTLIWGISLTVSVICGRRQKGVVTE